MAKHVLAELDLRTSAKFPTKFSKRPRNDDEDIDRQTEKHSVSDAAATKCRTVAAVADVPQPVSHQPRSNCIVTRSEMMAFFSLLGTPA